jgi:uncharacterized DUF497 family protein
MIIQWNDEKNSLLKHLRGVSFEQIVILLEENALIDVLDHPNKEKYGNQKLLLFNIENYIYVVPAVIDGGSCFLKTIYPSRKYTEKYLGGNK